jgi:hypothetical protein
VLTPTRDRFTQYLTHIKLGESVIALQGYSLALRADTLNPTAPTSCSKQPGKDALHSAGQISPYS